MANWKATVRLGDLWFDYKCGEITVHKLAHTTAERLKEVLPDAYTDDHEFKTVVDEMAAFPEDGTAWSFDNVMDRLYDWADEDHRLWVHTFP